MAIIDQRYLAQKSIMFSLNLDQRIFADCQRIVADCISYKHTAANQRIFTVCISGK